MMARHAPLAALGMILCLAGCSSEPLYKVNGKVHKNGQPLPVKELASGAGGRVMVRFHSLDQGKTDIGPQASIVKADGTFAVLGATGKGIPPGKYRVEITWQDPFPMGKDQLEGKFGKANSPVIVDVPSAEDIDINVASARKK
jgi:hypothetical protein